jgi:hypothetical protein
VRAAAHALQQHCGTSSEALSPATGGSSSTRWPARPACPTVVGAVERSARRDGRAHTGWPLVRWTAKLRPDPLKRLHVDSPAARTSLPPAGATQQVAVTNALAASATSPGTGLPQAWRDDLRRTVEVREERLADRLDRAVAGAGPTTGRSPRWQSLVGGPAVAARADRPGRRPLAARARRAGLPPARRRRAAAAGRGASRCRRCCSSAGLLCGALLAFLAGAVRARVGPPAGRRAERRLHEAVEQVAQDELLDPLAQEAAAHGAFCAALARAAA